MKNCFIIVNYNDYESTKHLIDNIIDYHIIDYIVIIDNNSKEKEKKLLSSIKHDKIHIIYNEENEGYAKAINKGTKFLIKKFNKCNLIISNSDIIILSEEDLKKLIDLLDYKNVGLVAPQLLERGKINRGIKNISPKLDALKNLPVFNKLVIKKHLCYKEDFYDSDVSFVDVVSTCFFLISSDVMKKICFLDENTFLYYEENILCKKIVDLGLMILLANNIRVKHNYSVSVDKSINYKDKVKMLKDSQFYYHTIYNKATKWEKILLKITFNIGFAFGVTKKLIKRFK